MAHSPALDRLWRWLRGGPSPAAGKSQAHHTGLRQQRSTRREMLFSLVRENMIRLGVLSSHYKFKVLTLDPAGDQFIVMMDWQAGASLAGPQFERECEKSLQSLLEERRQAYKVKAVYWRGAPATAADAVPARAPVARPAAAAGTPPPRREPPAPLPIEQVSDDELKALQAALRQAGGAPAAAPAPAARGTRRPPLETPDFEPTLNTAGQAATEFGSLSETQYGKLQ